jgi:hypothetical protein
MAALYKPVSLGRGRLQRLIEFLVLPSFLHSRLSALIPYLMVDIPPL